MALKKEILNEIGNMALNLALGQKTVTTVKKMNAANSQCLETIVTTTEGPGSVDALRLWKEILESGI